MPRGNDTNEAVQELAAQFGSFQNAEDLIRSWRARRMDKTLRAANKQALDRKATDDLDHEKIDSAVGDNYTLLSAAVRGGTVVAVVEDQLGRTHKLAVGDPKNLKLGDDQADPLARELAARSTTAPVPEGQGKPKDGGSGVSADTAAEESSKPGEDPEKLADSDGDEGQNAAQAKAPQQARKQGQQSRS